MEEQQKENEETKDHVVGGLVCGTCIAYSCAACLRALRAFVILLLEGLKRNSQVVSVPSLLLNMCCVH